MKDLVDLHTVLYAYEKPSAYPMQYTIGDCKGLKWCIKLHVALGPMPLECEEFSIDGQNVTGVEIVCPRPDIGSFQNLSLVDFFS